VNAERSVSNPMAKPKDKLVQWQRLDEKKCQPCGEQSPYWSWMAGGREPEVEAPTEPPHDPQLDSVMDALNNGAEDLMSTKERQAFQLVIREGLTYSQAAKTMRVKSPTVHKLVERAAKKLRILASIH
jgi:DNA-directed RNA polymerase specialized sigma24 family protein